MSPSYAYESASISICYIWNRYRFTMWNRKQMNANFVNTDTSLYTDTFANWPRVLQYPAIGTDSLIFFFSCFDSFNLVATLRSSRLHQIWNENRATRERQKKNDNHLIWMMKRKHRYIIHIHFDVVVHSTWVHGANAYASVMQRKLLHNNLISFEYSNANKIYWLSRSTMMMGVSRQPTENKRKKSENVFRSGILSGGWIVWSVCRRAHLRSKCVIESELKKMKKKKLKRKPFWIMAKVIFSGAMQ